MATMTLSVTAPGISASRDFALSDEDLVRLVSWASSAYTPAPSVDDPSPVALTPTEALFAWVNGLLAGTMVNVVNHERSEALKSVPEPTPLAIEAI